jgi:hypothetical protein
MKKILHFFFIFIISSNTVYAVDFKWTKIVTTSDNATEFYIEKKSIKKVGKLHFYWLMANYLKHEENDDPNVNSVITSNILNCKTSEVKTVTYTSFNSNRARGSINTEIIVPDEDINYFEWNYYDEDTSIGMVFQEVCKIQ